MSPAETGEGVLVPVTRPEYLFFVPESCMRFFLLAKIILVKLENF